MPKNTVLAGALVQAQGDATVAALANGYLRIYSGAQPATADTAVGAQVLLATLRFASPAAGATPTTGVITFNAIASGVAAASGTAAWYRCLKADGVTEVMDGSIDVAGNTPNLALSTTAIIAPATVSVSAFTHSLLLSAAGL